MREENRYPVRICNDSHTFEGDPNKGAWSVALNPRNTPPEVLVPGTRVFRYDSGDIEGEGIVQRRKRYDWVAEMILETMSAPGEEDYTNGRGPDPDAPEDEAGARFWRARDPDWVPGQPLKDTGKA
jgi:hypothetical protein